MNVKVKVTQSCPTLCDPKDLYNPWNSPGQNTAVGSLSLLQGIFSTQESNPSLLHCRWILSQLNHKGSPRILEWVAYPFSRGSCWPRSQTRLSYIAGGLFTNWAIREVCSDLREKKPPPTEQEDTMNMRQKRANLPPYWIYFFVLCCLCWLCNFCEQKLPTAWNTQDSPFSRLWPSEVWYFSISYRDKKLQNICLAVGI